MAEISLDIWSILLVASAIQGLVLFVLLIINSTQKRANRLLAGLLVLMVWVQVEFLFVRSAVELEFKLFYGTRHGVWLALGPLVLLYVKSVSDTSFSIGMKQLLHFLPFVVFTVFIPLFFAEAIPEQGKYYGMLSIIRNSMDGLTPLQTFYGFLFFLQFLHAIAYVVWTIFRVLNGQVASGSGAKVKMARHKWMRRYALVLVVILMFALSYFIILFYSSFYDRWMDYMLIVPTTLLMYLLVFKIYRSPYLFRDDLKYALSEKKYANSGLSERLSDLYEKQLVDYISLEKAYRNPGIKLSDVSNALSLPIHDLSQVINERFQCNFNEFINRHRIEEAKVLLRDASSDQNILEIAYAVGFNNKASFNNHFKKTTAMTPTEYQKTLTEKSKNL